ncbi:hypothetical protein [Rhodococcus maanshanensis]|uniref:DUF1499 domain-containing protein n=1 Tax=Rhodococcus maanshanensis TaxID=183556 RepID=A0A1H7Y3S0_9NOCA|nr:hypothetical protein [Rhodococcus maanshanensis]SEM40565.1 hypothetical protein SAMN05444583_13628 [Rhodococcus maanshanensis]
MAISRNAAYTFAAPPDVLFGLAWNTLNTVFGNVTQVAPTTLRAKTKLSLASWGEEVSVDVQQAPTGSVVTVTSRSRAGLQVIDWGVHRRNIDTVFAALAGALETARLRPAAGAC